MVGVPRRIVTIAVEEGNIATIVPVATGVQNRLQANTLKKFSKNDRAGVAHPCTPELTDKAGPEDAVGAPRRTATIAVEEGNNATIEPAATGEQNADTVVCSSEIVHICCIERSRACSSSYHYYIVNRALVSHEWLTCKLIAIAIEILSISCVNPTRIRAWVGNIVFALVKTNIVGTVVSGKAIGEGPYIAPEVPDAPIGYVGSCFTAELQDIT